MKENILMKSMGLVDDEYIAEAAPAAARPMTRIRRKIIRKYISLAACLAAVMILGQDVLVSLRLVPTALHILPQYTASGLAALMNGGGPMDGTPTNAYETVYAPTGVDPTVSPVPDSRFTKVYAGTFSALPLNEKSFGDFTEDILSRLAPALGTAVPAYTVKKDSASWGSSWLYAGSAKDGTLGVEWIVEQDAQRQEFSFSRYEKQPMILNGKTVEVDFSMTDEELREALVPLRDELFGIFGVSFTDMRIDRTYNGYSAFGADRLSVIFYNEDEHPLNRYSSIPLSDHLEIHVSISGKATDPVSQNCIVTYCQYRIPAKLRYTVSQVLPTVSLSRAEELLAKGYVFGNHVCELCMAAQDKIDFESYDYVGLTYHTSGFLLSDTVKEAVPFYAFYKKLEDTENGLTRYAVTYVPAVHMVGYESYFKNQKDNHREMITTSETPSEEP